MREREIRPRGGREISAQKNYQRGVERFGPSEDAGEEKTFECNGKVDY